jgi:hypothetical protein
MLHITPMRSVVVDEKCRRGRYLINGVVDMCPIVAPSSRSYVFYLLRAPV